MFWLGTTLICLGVLVWNYQNVPYDLNTARWHGSSLFSVAAAIFLVVGVVFLWRISLLSVLGGLAIGIVAIPILGGLLKVLFRRKR